MNGETIAFIKALQNTSIEKLRSSGGSSDAGKVVVVDENGNMKTVTLPVGQGEIGLDSSLSVSGAAADAKVVGDRLTEDEATLTALNGSLDTKVDAPFASEKITVTWNSELEGKYISSSGVVGDDENYHVSDLISVEPCTFYILRYMVNDPDNKRIRVHGYNESEVWQNQRTTYAHSGEVCVLTVLTGLYDAFIRISAPILSEIVELKRREESDLVFDATCFANATGHATYTINPDENSIVISTTAKYVKQYASSNSIFALYGLKDNAVYKWHFRADKISGTPNIMMAILDSSNEPLLTLAGADGEESSGYFITNSSMASIALYVTRTPSANASVKFSDVWIREVEECSEDLDLIRQSLMVESNKPLVLLHYSDIHGDSVARKKIIDFKKTYTINDVISTGDAPYFSFGYAKLTDGVPIPVEDYNENTEYVADDLCVYGGTLYKCTTATSGVFNSSDWASVSTAAKTNYGSKNAYLNSELATLSLFCVGNHDILQYVYNPSTGNISNVGHWYDLPREYAYNTWIEPYKDGWGITTPGGTELYWYKDYPTQKVRIVAIDMQYWDAEERTWLDATLSEAQTLGYGVILLSHSLLGSFVGNPDVTFQYWTTTNTTEGLYKSDSTGYYGAYRPGNAFSTLIPYRDIIICNLCGHSHIDRFGYTKLDDTENRQLLTIQIDQAGILRDTSGSDRYSSNNRYVFNLVTIDTTTKLLKIVRFGNHMDRFLRRKKSLCVRYETGEILANN